MKPRIRIIPTGSDGCTWCGCVDRNDGAPVENLPDGVVALCEECYECLDELDICEDCGNVGGVNESGFHMTINNCCICEVCGGVDTAIGVRSCEVYKTDAEIEAEAEAAYEAALAAHAAFLEKYCVLNRDGEIAHFKGDF